MKPSDEEAAKTVITELLSDMSPLSSLMERVGEKNKNRFRQSVLNPLLEAGLIEPTIKDKLKSSKQAYRLTEKARQLMTS